MSGGKLRKDPENSLARFRLFPLQRLPTRARLPARLPPPLPPPRAFLPPSAPFPCSRERRCVSVEAEFPPLFSPPPTPPSQRKFRVSFAALRRRYIPNHPYLSAYAIRASYIPARVPVENVLRSSLYKYPKLSSPMCVASIGGRRKWGKKGTENKGCSRVCLQTREREREFFIFLHLVLIRRPVCRFFRRRKFRNLIT